MDNLDRPAGREPDLLVPALAGFYDIARDLSWLVTRLTIGGMLLVHGINKVMGPGVEGVAKGMAGRGIEPAEPAAIAVIFLETVGALCIMGGVATRFFAAGIAIEFLFITFNAHWGNGFGWSSPRGGWEYPLLWGLMFFAIALRGGGPYSIDRKIGKEL